MRERKGDLLQCIKAKELLFFFSQSMPLRRSASEKKGLIVGSASVLKKGEQ